MTTATAETRNPKTKRNALRYRVPPRQVSYHKEGETGEATLLNISQAGFLVELATVPVKPGDRVSISLTCFPPYQKNGPLTLDAEVTRVDFDQFAAAFLDITTEYSSFLLAILSTAARSNKL